MKGWGCFNSEGTMYAWFVSGMDAERYVADNFEPGSVTIEQVTISVVR